MEREFLVVCLNKVGFAAHTEVSLTAKVKKLDLLPSLPCSLRLPNLLASACQLRWRAHLPNCRRALLASILDKTNVLIDMGMLWGVKHSDTLILYAWAS